MGQAMLLGAGDESRSLNRALHAIQTAAGKLHADADRRFRADASEQNYGEVLLWKQRLALAGGEVQWFPQVRHRVRPAGSYTVASGDTLQAVSEKFYGSPGYWDIIFIPNRRVIGPRPGVLRPGMVLEIP
jgi:nucleoid-associated protein YgaU